MTLLAHRASALGALHLAERRKFPSLLAATRSYELLAKNFVRLLRPSGSWVAFCFCLILGTGQLSRAMPSDPALFFLLYGPWISLGLLGIGLAGTAHTWHRGILLNIQPAGLFDVATQPFWRHVGYGLILFLALLVPVALTGGLSLAVPTGGPLAPVVVLLPLVAGAMLVTRFSLVLPAAAVEERRLTFRMSWMMTNGNTLRLLFGGLLVVVPALTVSQLFIRLFDGLAWSWSPYVVARPVIAVTSLCVVAALGTIYLSLGYRFFAQRRDRLEDGDDLDALRDAFS